MSKPRGVVLDVDGTLVDSNEQHARAWCEALEANGFRAPYGTVRGLIGMGGDKLFPRMTGLREDSEAGEATSTSREKIFRSKYLSTIRPFEGAREMVARLRDTGTEIAIASSADPEERMALLEIARVLELIGEEDASAEADRSKPDPEIVKAALTKLGLPAESAVMVGDTPYDIEAAALAGIRTVAFRCGGLWTDDDLVGAIEIRDGPWEWPRRRGS